VATATLPADHAVLAELETRFGAAILARQSTVDNVPTAWVARDRAHEVVRHLKEGVEKPYRALYDLTVIDERARQHRQGQPPSDFTFIYHLLSFDRNEDIRVKVPLEGEFPSIPTVTDLWPAANWYEREAWDMFGVNIEGHPHLKRILLPEYWVGHALRKEHPARATEMGPYELQEDANAKDEERLRFHPEEWGLKRSSEGEDFLFLNVGPQHPGTHGVLRIVLQLDGEVIRDCIAEIGFHHRGAEKMAERQSWHTFIPYTDRIDYLGGVMNNLPYVMAVEKLAGITVPDRSKVIRIMMAEFFRIANHLVWYGTFAQDLGALSPVFFTFNDRERIFDIVEAICGGRMHPSWFRIGGVSQDLPEGWEKLVKDFIDYFPPRLREYDKEVLQNMIFKARTKGVGVYDLDEAIEWGVTGPNLRSIRSFNWDLRKKRPYSGYDQFEFDIPVAERGDCYDRAAVRVEEMRQSLRIIEQCMKNMPAGDFKARHPLTTPPLKERTMHDIETLITHFLNVSWGPVIPPGECAAMVEGTKGLYSYYAVSDGSTAPYRVRIRTASFPHMQTLPLLTRNLMVPDLLAILGAMDFVLADIDR
jgi:NADH-quinone oxidoreductase subunit C/D